MSVHKVTTNGQVTIPKEIRERVHLEVGDLIEFLVEGNKIVIVPKKLIDADQAWFWTEEWQEKEREADEALRKGEFEEFDRVEDLLNDLHS